MKTNLIFKRINSNSHMTITVNPLWRFHAMDGGVDGVQSSSAIVPMSHIHENHYENEQGE